MRSWMFTVIWSMISLTMVTYVTPIFVITLVPLAFVYYGILVCKACLLLLLLDFRACFVFYMLFACLFVCSFVFDEFSSVYVCFVFTFYLVVVALYTCLSSCLFFTALAYSCGSLFTLQVPHRKLPYPRILPLSLHQVYVILCPISFCRSISIIVCPELVII